MVGDAAYQVVFVWLVASIAHSPAVLAAVLAAAAIPRAGLLLLGGAVTDRVSARTVMLVAHLARAATLSVLTAVALTAGLRVWELAVAGALCGTAEAFLLPAAASIQPTLVPARDLPRANALVTASEQAAAVLGPIVGGALLATSTPALTLGLNAATFVLAAGTMLGAPRPSRTGHDRGVGPNVWAAIRGGIGYAAGSFEVRIVLLLVTAATLSYSGLFAVGLPTLAAHVHGGSLALGVLLSAWGLGQLLGAVAASLTGLPNRWGLLIIVMPLTEGACFAVLGFLPRYPLAVVLLALLGVGVAYDTDVALPTFVQIRTPPPLLGRVNAVITLPRYALEPVSIACMGALALLGVRWMFAAAALPMLTAGTLLTTSRTARQLRSGRTESRSPVDAVAIPPA